MKKSNRFRDEQKQLSDFDKEVWVVCPSCTYKAIVIANDVNKIARLSCIACGYNKEVNIMLNEHTELKIAAHLYFDAVLWLQLPFRSKEVFFAYNPEHLVYLEQYIAASIREHHDRTHFTLLEKLPKFYHDAKNRTALLKLIRKLKEKSNED